jgi:hypothetical protein
MKIIVHHQNFMLAVREMMGWPNFKPANDCIGWSSGREMNIEIGTDLARVAQTAGKDLIYTGWASSRAKDPTSFAIAFREMLTVDIVDHIVPFTIDDQSRIILVSTRKDECFAIDHRGSLVRIVGKPKGIGKGRALAMKRIKAAASAMADAPLPGNAFVQPGGDWIEPKAPIDTLVRFG